MGYRVKVVESKIDGNQLENEVLIYADSVSDIPEPKENWAGGSACIIMDTQEVKFLTTEGEWV